MFDIISIVGTRPEIIRILSNLKNHLIVDSGQHYDYEMSEIFWKERGIKPDLNLKARSLGEIYERSFELIKKNKPKLVISYGDTRTSLAVSLATKDAGTKLIHLEAGVRSGDMEMPEERNRIIIDAIADYLFAVNKRCKENLLKENVKGKIFIVGDLVFDRYLKNRKHGRYILMTLHRKQNQNSLILKKILKEFRKDLIIFPIHPVMKKYLSKSEVPENLKIIQPVGYSKLLEMIKDAKLVITDSGGVQREAFFMGVPVRIILKKNPWKEEIQVFGDGHAEERIKYIIENKIL